MCRLLHPTALQPGEALFQVADLLLPLKVWYGARVTTQQFCYLQKPTTVMVQAVLPAM